MSLYSAIFEILRKKTAWVTTGIVLVLAITVYYRGHGAAALTAGALCLNALALLISARNADLSRLSLEQSKTWSRQSSAPICKLTWEESRIESTTEVLKPIKQGFDKVKNCGNGPAFNVNIIVEEESEKISTHRVVDVIGILGENEECRLPTRLSLALQSGEKFLQRRLVIQWSDQFGFYFETVYSANPLSCRFSGPMLIKPGPGKCGPIEHDRLIKVDWGRSTVRPPLGRSSVFKRLCAFIFE